MHCCNEDWIDWPENSIPEDQIPDVQKTRQIDEITAVQ